MNITPHDYARGLVQALRKKEVDEISPLIERFVGILTENNDLSKAPQVMAVFSSLWDAADGVVSVIVSTARVMEPKEREVLEQALTTSTGAKKIVITEEIDEHLLGGMVVRYKDKVLDTSVRTKIRSLRDSLIS